MVQKKIVIVLGLIVLLPLIIYTTYEITALSENEEIVEEVFQRQMNLVLRSVNNNTWDAATDWSNKLDQIITARGGSIVEGINEFLVSYVFIKSVVITGVGKISPEFYMPKHHSDVPKDKITNALLSNVDLITGIVNKQASGYRKFTPVRTEGDTLRNDLLLLHAVKQDNEYIVAGVLLDINSFIENIISPSFLELSREEFVIALFKNGNDQPVFSTDTVDNYKAELNKRVWLLPDYYIGIALQDDRFENMAANRFKRSLLLIAVLTVILLSTGFYLFRNINREIELAKMKTGFVSNVSHELRTPLALIRMFAETIELGRTTGDEEVKEYCNIIRNESERLTLLINRILDFSKIDADEKRYSLKKADLNKVVCDIQNFYKYHLHNKGFELESEIDSEQLSVLADSDALAESLVNLLDNAMKYSRDDKVIKISTGTENGFAFVEVTDKGIGIPENMQSKIFDKFYRVENSLTASTSGSGLGLSLVKHIVDAHNGKISIRSNVNEGSTFRIEIPLAAG